MDVEDKLTAPFYYADDMPARLVINGDDVTIHYDEGKTVNDFQRYRQEHRRCKFCTYCKKKTATDGTRQYSLSRCMLKDKLLRAEPFNRFQGCLCRWYKIKEEKNEI